MENNEDDCNTSSFCLSFSSYTCDQIAETAERVRLEFSGEHCNEDFEFVNLQTNCEAVSSLFPIFQRILIAEDSSPVTVKTQLRDLFLLEPSSPSSSDEEEEEEVYCPSGGWRKSKSTGSSQRWRIKEMLLRSFSEGKQSLKFLNSNSVKRCEEESSKKKEKKRVCAHEKFYLRNKAVKEEEKRKSYLPYKKHLFGFFYNTGK